MATLMLFLAIIVILFLAREITHKNKVYEAEKRMQEVATTSELPREICAKYFKLRVDVYLKGKINNLMKWEFADNALPISLMNKPYFSVDVTRKDGSSERLIIKTCDVKHPYDPLEYDRPERKAPKTEPLTPAQEWCIKHATELENEVQKAMEDNNKTFIYYSLDPAGKTIIEELAEHLCKVTLYDVSAKNGELLVDFTTALLAQAQIG